MPKGLSEVEARLVADLEHIALSHAGPFQLTREAIEWGNIWYEHHYKNRPAELDDDRFSGYIARKQTHIHKLAMILSAAQRDTMFVERDDLALANTMVTDLEKDMAKVFAKIGRTNQSVQAERFIHFVQKRGIVPYGAAYQYIHSAFPNVKDFENIVSGAVRAGYIEIVSENGQFLFKAKLS